MKSIRHRIAGGQDAIHGFRYRSIVPHIIRQTVIAYIVLSQILNDHCHLFLSGQSFRHHRACNGRKRQILIFPDFQYTVIRTSCLFYCKNIFDASSKFHIVSTRVIAACKIDSPSISRIHHTIIVSPGRNLYRHRLAFTQEGMIAKDGSGILRNLVFKDIVQSIRHFPIHQFPCFRNGFPVSRSIGIQKQLVS